MNPPDQPTPRTDAAWAKTFEDELNIFWSGNAANKMREECATLERELADAKAECDLHRNRLASILWSGAIDKQLCGDVQQWADDYIAELTRLRAEVERLTKQIKDDNRSYGCELRDANGTIWQQATKDHARAEKAEAELITEQTRLDYLGLHMGTRMVAEALNCDYSKCFPIRDAIDLAMKNETTP